MNIEDMQRRAEVSSGIFTDRLRGFVKRWAPEDRRDCYEFQMDLTRLMVDAMRHQTTGLSNHLDHMFSERVLEQSMFPLRVIHEEPKR